VRCQKCRVIIPGAMRLCSYVVREDTGFAPNPFGRYCTLAACTPNHQGLRLHTGDWLVGHEPISRGTKLVYAMKVSEIPNFNTYFNDSRFEYKKPYPAGNWQARCGDNIYHRAGNVWRQEWSPFHNRPQDLEQDTRHPQVFVAEEFYYFGENAHRFHPSFQRSFGGVRDVAVPTHLHW
jgi:hypothetical protein